jgi:hypothetical protein
LEIAALRYKDTLELQLAVAQRRDLIERVKAGAPADVRIYFDQSYVLHEMTEGGDDPESRLPSGKLGRPAEAGLPETDRLRRW